MHIPVLKLSFFATLALAQSWRERLTKPLSYFGIDTSHSAIADKTIIQIGTKDAWKTVLADKLAVNSTIKTGKEEVWWLFTAGNETCKECPLMEHIYKEAVYQLTTSGLASPLTLTFLETSCDKSPRLCTDFSTTKLPALYHVSYNSTSEKTELRQVPFNSPNAESIVKMNKSGTWKNYKTWSGPLNPIDGKLSFILTAAGLAMGGWGSSFGAFVPGMILAIALSSATGYFLQNFLFKKRSKPVAAPQDSANEEKPSAAAYSLPATDIARSSATPPPTAASTRSRRSK